MRILLSAYHYLVFEKNTIQHSLQREKSMFHTKPGTVLVMFKSMQDVLTLPLRLWIHKPEGNLGLKTD
jgi:hypothetical protein